jgi:hypothetical protein
MLYKQIQGEWVSIENSDRIIFTNEAYVRGTQSGLFRIYGNKIIFLNTGDEFSLNISKDYMVLDGVYYLRR